MYVTLDLVEIRDASSFILYLFFIWMFHWYCWSFRDVFVLFLSKCYLCLAFNHLNMLIHTFIHLHVLIHTFKHLHMLIHTFNHLHMLIHTFNHLNMLFHTFNHLYMLIHTFNHLHMLIHTFNHLHIHIFNHLNMLIHTFNHLHMLIHSVYSKTHDFFDWLLHFISLYGGNTVVYYGFFNNYWCYAPAFTPGF
jgi:hypothetical protein